MCDYSLCGIPNRLAIEGEELVVHRFSTGAIGLVSPAELLEKERVPECAPRKTWWQTLLDFFACPPPFSNVSAVCIPPGALLILRGIPVDLQRQCRVSSEEGAVFTQLSADINTYRDAVRFRNGMELRLQCLPQGMCVEVLSLSGMPEYETAGAGTRQSALARRQFAQGRSGG